MACAPPADWACPWEVGAAGLETAEQGEGAGRLCLLAWTARVTLHLCLSPWVSEEEN